MSPLTSFQLWMPSLNTEFSARQPTKSDGRSPLFFSLPLASTVREPPATRYDPVLSSSSDDSCSTRSCENQRAGIIDGVARHLRQQLQKPALLLHQRLGAGHHRCARSIERKLTAVRVIAPQQPVAGGAAG